MERDEGHLIIKMQMILHIMVAGMMMKDVGKES
jgi:hypothetical protein